MKNPYLFLLFFAFAVSAQDKFEVYFDFNKDVPTQKSEAGLLDWIKANPNAVVTKLAGYCDSVDVNSYNKELASRRIGTVLKTLESAGAIIPGDVKLEPMGEDFSLSADAAKNRRVDVFYRKNSATSADKENRSQSDISDADNKEVPDTAKIHPPLESLFAKAKVGDVIKIENINFYFNSEVVIPESEPRIEELYESMVKNPNLSIEIHGHICCNPNINDTKLSYRRAKYIFTYLLKKGIPLNRLAYKGFGSSRPIYKIPERTREEMAANRRVEIKIVKI